MESPSASIRNAARLILAAEAAAWDGSNLHEASLACEKLRARLARVAGPDGFTALSRQALARAEVPAMETVELDRQLRKMMLVVKMRGSEHSIDMREYTITGKGVVIGEPLRGYRGLTTGIPGPWVPEAGELPELSQDGENNR